MTLQKVLLNSSAKGVRDVDEELSDSAVWF